MNGKKITSSVLAAIMLAGTTNVFAAMPDKSVVIGEKAFAFKYANADENKKEILDAMKNKGEGSIYVKAMNKWYNNDNSILEDTSVIPAVVYTNVEGETADYEAADGEVSNGVSDEFEVVDVSAISNTKIKVELKEEVEAVSTAGFQIVKKGTEDVVEVIDATVEGDVVILTTDAMDAGQAYTITANEVSKNFTGIAKKTSAPTVKTVNCVDTERVEISFDMPLDRETAEDVANYTLNKDATVLEAKLSGSRKTVTLTTEGVTKNKMFILKIADVLSADDVKVAKTSRNFVGKVDTLAATISKVVPVNNTRIEVLFSDVNGVDKESAENVSNYTIKTGTTELEIESIEAVLNTDTYLYDKVIIVTEAQTAGKKYTVEIDNLKDGSVAENINKKALKGTFYGRVADKTSPSVDPASVEVLSNTKVRFTINETNALDYGTVLDLNNYEFNNDLEVLNVEVEDQDEPYTTSGRTVILTTSEQTKSKSYTLTVKGISDEFGNAMKTVGSSYRKYYFVGKGDDVTPPHITNVKVSNNTIVYLTFNEVVNKEAAEDPTNYDIAEIYGSHDIGSPISATVTSSGKGKVVKLVMASQKVNKTYGITINNIADASGNETVDAYGEFIGKRVENDNERPEMLYAEALHKDEVWVYMSEAVDTSSTEFTAENLSDHTTVVFELASSRDDDTLLVFKPKTGTLVNNATYKITDLRGVTDPTGNTLRYVAAEAPIKFIGTTRANIAPEVVNWEQRDAKTVRVYFNEEVQVTGTLGTVVISGNDTPTAYYQGSDKTYVDFIVGTNYDYNKTTEMNFSNIITDMAGTAAKDEKTPIVPYIIDEEKPVIANVYADDNTNIVVEYDEKISSYSLRKKGINPILGNYRVSYDEDNVTKYVNIKSVYRYSDTKVGLETSTPLSATIVYKLVPINGVKDIAGNLSSVRDVEHIFTGSEVINSDYIKGVKIVNGTTINVGGPVTSVKEVLANDTLSGDLVASTDSDDNVTLTVPLVSGSTYRVSTANDSCDFDGIVQNGGLRVVRNDSTAAEITYAGLSTANHTVTVYNVADLTPETVTVVGDRLIIAKGDVAANDKLYVVVKDNAANNVLYAANVTVEAGDVANPDQYYVDSAKTGLDYAGFTFTASEDKDTVKGNITLPETATIDGQTVAIAWAETADTSNVAAYATGTVTITQSATDDVNEVVTLTATLTKGTISETKEFTFTVLEGKAPTVTSSILEQADSADDAKIALAEGDSHVFTFSEALDASSVTAVENALAIAGTNADKVTKTWNADNTALTVALADDADAGTTLVAEITVTGNVTANITDAAGNTTSDAILITDN
ncbi:Ig-like domain-containing protein [Oceanirhabdus seepicola]|uniref:Atrophied bacterial Ig domain-containing protein n=1 Tax=Oceanirhabdus seepicola TaxID=2828781 RepID=A0A9J6P158_9CLOT|nr:Ig-like domain-containing protein [Oceanirhabdus seepicola]MCM1990259.1 hypothetical protein [Oceanirhabdus seepicola]